MTTEIPATVTALAKEHAYTPSVAKEKNQLIVPSVPRCHQEIPPQYPPMPYFAILQPLQTTPPKTPTTKISSRTMLKTLKVALEINNLPAVVAPAPLIRLILNGAPPIHVSRTQIHMSLSSLPFTTPHASSASNETG